MGPTSPTRTHPHWIGLRPVKLVKIRGVCQATHSVFFSFGQGILRAMVEYLLLNWAFPRLVTSFRCRVEFLLHDANTVCSEGIQS